ncbi:MAG: hypothetical protein WCZ23_10675 [Rhodospirillaceae bacterium]
MPQRFPHPKDPVGCRYIHGDVPGLDWHYCQKPQIEGSPYCAEHHAACTVPPDQAEAHLRALVAALARAVAA